MVSQSRRWNPQLARLRAMVAAARRDRDRSSTEFFRSARFGGFREEMAAPAARRHGDPRLRLGAVPARRRAGAGVLRGATTRRGAGSPGTPTPTAVFEMDGGARYVYNGSWCSPGARRRGTAPGGSAARRAPRSGTATTTRSSTPRWTADVPAGPPYSGIAGALQVFAEALRTGREPSGEVHENVHEPGDGGGGGAVRGDRAPSAWTTCCAEAHARPSARRPATTSGTRCARGPTRATPWRSTASCTRPGRCWQSCGVAG